VGAETADAAILTVERGTVGGMGSRRRCTYRGQRHGVRRGVTNTSDCATRPQPGRHIVCLP